MSETSPIPAKRGRKPKHTTGVPGALKGVPLPTIMPDILTAEFVRDHAADVLKLVYGHAYSCPTTARWLAENIFAGGWAPPHPALVGPATYATLEAAKAGVLDAYVAGKVSEAALGSITDGLLSRMAALNAGEGASI